MWSLDLDLPPITFIQHGADSETPAFLYTFWRFVTGVLIIGVGDYKNPSSTRFGGIPIQPENTLAYFH